MNINSKASKIYSGLREAHSTSIGFVRPKTIDDITIEDRPKEEYDEFMRKLKANEQRSKQENLFPASQLLKLRH